MAKIIVEKSPPLVGRVRVGGAKNAALPILAATLLSNGNCILEDVPDLQDVKIMLKLVNILGAKSQKMSKNEVKINSEGLENWEAPYELMSRMRASFLVMGPLLARLGKARISMPGGCAIGTRPIDLHLKGFEAMGAKIDIGNGYVEAVVDKLVGADIYLDFPSVGATENILMAASLAEGETIIENAAMEPEIIDLANFINKIGGNVKGAGTNTIRVKGVGELYGARHPIIPDRIEAGTFMVAAAVTKGDITVDNILSNHVRPIIAKLHEAGVEVIENEDSIRVIGKEKIKSANIKTLPYPGFPTDMQSQFMTLMALSEDTSVVVETVFENRFMHAEELIRMGANIKLDGRTAIVSGVEEFTGCSVKATDLRAGASLILAGLVADGKTEIGDIYHIERGYEDIVGKISSLGGKIYKK